MAFSRQSLMTKGKRPFTAASRVLHASSTTASRVFNATAPTFATRAFARASNKTSSLIQRGLSRAYSTGKNGPEFNGGQTTGAEVPLYRKLIKAWTETPTKWYPIPIAVGAILLVVIQYRKNSRKRNPEVIVDEDGVEVVKLKGPWQVHVMGALPLRNMSRLWGYMNSLQLPVWFRPYGFKMYAFAFGCNLDEIDPQELEKYASLGDFFYRKLKPGARPVDDAILVSPADGTVLHFGTIKDSRVEQVKGITYSLDALLGVERPGTPTASVKSTRDQMEVVNDHDFANVNGIEYTLDQLIGGQNGHARPSSSTGSSSSNETTPLLASGSTDPAPQKYGERVDASVHDPSATLKDTLAHDAGVARDMGVPAAIEGAPVARPLARRRSTSDQDVRPGHSLFFTVIYLAPGDYHRFHSPTAWVVEKRRHFVGELFSVSPYMAKRLENLFVLNERVALLGRWRYGFFGMVPVGATNVGSIKINFDQELRTNVRGRRPPPGTYTEAVYSAASPILNGQPLSYAEEMGGFCLGSTIVLIFEAPSDFEFAIQAGQKIKVGNKLGDVPRD
ncbi:phosphatidylserine decarboxylase-domain-containing protein [Schizophyllum commune]